LQWRRAEDGFQLLPLKMIKMAENWWEIGGKRSRESNFDITLAIFCTYLGRKVLKKMKKQRKSTSALCIIRKISAKIQGIQLKK